MTDDTTPAASGGGTPWHLWVVGILSLLWNSFGAYDFIMTNTQGEAYMRSAGMDDAMIAYFNAMPMWMYAPWIAGVWGAVLGSLALLLRKRWAVYLFAVSLVGAAVSLVYGLLNPMPMAEGMEMMKYMPWVIVAIAAFLWWYAGRMAARGVLR
ncbi:hypothetical protein [Brevundimonas aveniformis]|uniref:hypothetical protein n=1 Tax=Brevundimonas aveniformis TaxID=370977 RepID=UPI0003F5B995|nr:hypothetical protein [Brevundimonas aveniformis]